MELKGFLKNNIVEFLDSKSDKKREIITQTRSEEAFLFSVERDYVAEVKSALAANNIDRAKNIFDQLRDNYNHLAKGTDEKEKIYSIVQEVYASIKEYFDGVKGMSLKDEIKDISLHGLDDVPAPISEVAKNKEITDHEAKLTLVPKTPFELEALKAQTQRAELEQKMTDLLSSINQHLSSHTLKEAIDEYRLLKELFASYPSDDKFRKTDWFNKVMGTYSSIKQYNVQSQIASQKVASDKTFQERVVLSHEQIVSSIKNIIKNAIESLDKNDIHATESFIIDANHRLSKLDGSFEKEKNAFQGILSKLTNRIQFLKTQTLNSAQASGGTR